MPRDVSLSDSKCWNSGNKWVKNPPNVSGRGFPVQEKKKFPSILYIYTLYIIYTTYKWLGINITYIWLRINVYA